MLTKCELCGGDMTVAALSTQMQEVRLVGSRSMAASSIEARVCTECGHVMLYAEAPSVLRPPAGGNDKTHYELGEFRAGRGGAPPAEKRG